MKRQRRKNALIVFISLIFLFVSTLPVYADNPPSSSILKPQKIGSVTIRNNVTAEINNLVMLPADNGNSVGFVMTIHNNSNTDLDFINYWVDLYSKSGTKYSVNVASSNINKIPAKTSSDIMFYSNVGKDVKITDLIIKVIEWDFSYQDFRKVLGEISVGKNYSDMTPAGYGRMISAGDTRLSIVIDRANIGKSEKYHRPNIKITVKNEGKRSVAIPEYEIAIVTQDGLIYPLTARDLKGTVLAPLAEKEIQLTVSIPKEVDSQNWKMAIIQPINEGKYKVPVALFELPKATLDEAGDVGKEYTFSTSDGVYYVKLSSLNRLPLEDNDLIVSNLILSNKSNETLTIPNLAAKYTFNETIEKTATVRMNNKVISIPPGDAIEFQAVSTVPYTFEISKVNLTLQQKDSGSEELTDLVEFTHSGEFNPVPDAGDVYVNEELGYRSNVSIRNKYTFEGSNASIIAAEIQVENLEKRQSEIQKFAGYFERDDGTIYPATFHKIDEKVYPGGKALLYAYSTVPKDFDFSNMKLVIGKALEETNGQTSNLVGYVSPFSLNLPDEKEVQKGLKNIDLSPYELSIERVATQANFTSNLIQLEFDYYLEQDLLTKSSMKERKIIVEIKDGDKKASFSRELVISDSESLAGNNALKVGRHTIKLDPWQDEQMVLQINLLKEFDLNIYAEFEPGYKKLLATQKIPWFVNRSFSN